MSDQTVYQSRRERREAERSKDQMASSAPIVEERPFSRPTPQISTPDIFLEPVRSTDFASTTNLGAEPVTASIIINTVPDLDSNQIVITGSGGVIRTGSIEVPSVDPATGSIVIVNSGQEADEAINEDSLNSFVSSVAPLRAAGIAKTRSKVVELTLVNRKGQGQVYAVMSTAVLMITVGAFVVAAFMLGIFR